MSLPAAEQPRDRRRASLPSDDPTRMDEELDSIVPDSANKPYDMRNVVRHVVDDGEFFEIHEHYAKNIVCGFARLDGYAVGDRRQPAGADGGRARHRLLAPRRRASCAPATRSTSRSSRSATSPASCPAPRRSGAGSSATARSSSTPTPRRRSRRSRSSPARPTAAPTTSWPPSTCSPTSTSPGRPAEIAVMGPEGAVNIIYRRDLAASPTPDERRQKLIDDYKARFANPYSAAERGYIDDVIVPHETRPKLIAALETLQTKHAARPEAQAREHPALAGAWSAQSATSSRASGRGGAVVTSSAENGASRSLAAVVTGPAGASARARGTSTRPARPRPTPGGPPRRPGARRRDGFRRASGGPDRSPARGAGPAAGPAWDGTRWDRAPARRACRPGPRPERGAPTTTRRRDGRARPGWSTTPALYSR